MDESNGLKKLQDARLFSPGSYLVTGSLVRRYNECLDLIGVEKTKLKSFHIDGMGWSSEVAKEKGDPYYLSQDGSVAIIISTAQEGRVMFFPFFSFSKKAVSSVFNNAGNYVRDILEQASIVVNIDTHVSEKDLTPYGLLRIDRASLSFSVTRGLAEKSVQQKKLVEQFANGGWISPKVRANLVESIQQNGDLRYKNLNLSSMDYFDVDCFYTRALGGLFVFRSLNGLAPMIIFSDKPEKGKGVKLMPNTHIFNLHEKDLRDYFLKENLIGVYEYELMSDKGRKRLERLRDLMLIDGFLKEAGKKSKTVNFEFFSHNEARKRTAKRLHDGGYITKAYYVFGELLNDMDRGNSPMRRLENERVPQYSLLLRPNPELPEYVRNLIWQMIVRKSPFDIFRLFIHDREEFYRQFLTWSEARQDWAVEYLQRNFEPEQVV